LMRGRGNEWQAAVAKWVAGSGNGPVMAWKG
jgi:hypothetical protein